MYISRIADARRALHTILSSTKAAQVQPRRIAYEGAAHGPSPRTASLLAKPAAVVARVGLGCQPHHQPLVHKLEIVDRVLCVLRVLGVVVDDLSYSKAGTTLSGSLKRATSSNSPKGPKISRRLATVICGWI